MASPTAHDDTYVGIFLLEQPKGWWLPAGYALDPTGLPSILAWDPTDTPVNIYPVPGYQPPPERVESIDEVIRQEIGPLGPVGIGPQWRDALGMNRSDLLGTVNRTIMAPVDAAAALLDLPTTASTHPSWPGRRPCAGLAG